MKKSVIQAVSLVAIAATAFFGCRSGGGAGGGVVDVPDTPTDDLGVYVMDISQETEWNYLVVADDGSSMFIDVDESTEVPARVFIKPDKDSDSGTTVFFKENGLPDRVVADGHILYFGNFTGNRYDLAVIYPDSRIEYHFGVETEMDWDNYGKASGLSKASSFGGWLAQWALPAVVTAATCGAAFAVPALWVGCGMGVVSNVGRWTVEAVDYFCESCDVGGWRLAFGAFDCADLFLNEWASMIEVADGVVAAKACIDFMSEISDAIVSQNYRITMDKSQEINDATEIIDGGAGGEVTTYTVAFNANGGSGDAPGLRTVNAGSSTTIPGQGDLTRNGYSFGGWNTDYAGTGAHYGVGSSFTPTRSTTLYAQWTSITYTITFDANGGSGDTPGARTVNAGSDTKLPEQGNLRQSGYKFDGWNTNIDGEGANYRAGSYYTPTASVTLYARWERGWVRGSQFNPNIDYTSFTDSRDGKSYTMVAIGGQTWMAENLDYDAANSVCYKNSPDSCDKYGRLYLLADAKDACPAGWHLPDDGEWTALRDYAGGYMTAGRHLKSQIEWNNCGPSGSGNSYVCADTYGFSALPGGAGYIFFGEQNFSDVGKIGYWWSATGGAGPNGEADVVWRREMGNSIEMLQTPFGGLNDVGKFQFSVRCLRD